MRFVVIREQGRGWKPSRAMRQQDHWPDHVTFIDGMVDQGSMILGGALSEFDGDGEPADPTDAVGPNRTYRALIVLEADTQEEVTKLLHDDPWSKHHVLETAAIYRWEMLVGEIVSAWTR